MRRSLSRMPSSSDSNDLSAAYVLHTRKYRDTSLIAELYTQAQGRVAVVAKGARSTRGVKQAIWQPFTPLLISYIGKGDLKTVVSEIMAVGSSTVGACGDVSRNVMTTCTGSKTVRFLMGH